MLNIEEKFDELLKNFKELLLEVSSERNKQNQDISDLRIRINRLEELTTSKRDIREEIEILKENYGKRESIVTVVKDLEKILEDLEKVRSSLKI